MAIPPLIPAIILDTTGMRFVVGQLPIVLSLLLFAGCALPDRTISRSDDFGFRSKDQTQPQRDSKASDRLTFKSPQRKRTVTNDIGRSSDVDSEENAGNARISSKSTNRDSLDLNPGHSSDQATDSQAVSKMSTEKANTDSRSISRRSKAEEIRLAAGIDDEGQELGQNRIKQQSDGRTIAPDASGSVQLQGLEFENREDANERSDTRRSEWDDPDSHVSAKQTSVVVTQSSANGSEIQLWADRPDHRTAEKPTGKQAATKPDSKAIKQVTHGELPAPQVAPPASALPPLPWQADLERLIERVEQSLSHAGPNRAGDKHSELLRKQAQLRLLYLMAQRQQDALTAIPDAEPQQQEFWQQMIWAMSTAFDTTQFPDASDRAAQALPPLSAALRQLREEAPLSIKNMTFCRKISYFGNYERFPRNEFTPGHEVLLYTEIENFVSTPTLDGEYRTSLKSLIEIADSAGKVVWSKGFPPTEDFCRNPRRDYFHNYQFHIPKDLSTGAYSLKLTIVDELSHKRVSNSLNFVLK